MADPANRASVDPILLSHFACVRLGRAKEAEAYLRAAPESFKGPADERLLLLEACGRVTNTWPSKDSSRSQYYRALTNLKDGKTDEGRKRLKDLAKTQPKDDVLGVAAQIELERLAASTHPAK
jgi:predicted Zn-dependent protease